MSKTYLKILIASLIFLLTGVAPYSSAWALPGDIDESGRVDGFDLITFSRAYDSTDGDAHWNPRADLNRDGTVDDADLAILRDYFGRIARSQGCWVADFANDRVVLLGAETGNQIRLLENLNDPTAVGVNVSNGITWIANKGANEIIRLEYDADGSPILRRISGFSAPESVSVNSLDGSCWVADTGNDRIVRLAEDTPDGYDLVNNTGYHKNFIGFNSPKSVSVNHNEGSCWVADTYNDRIVKLLANVPDGYDVGSDSEFHAVLTGFQDPVSLSVNYVKGTCWVADTGNNQVALVAQNGVQVIRRTNGFSSPRSVSINPLDNSCWVADYNNNQVVKLAQSGVIERLRVGGLSRPISVSVELFTGGCWVADYYHDQVVKLSTGGTELHRLDGFNNPIFVLSVPGEEPATRRRPEAVAAWEKLGNLDVRFDASGSRDVDGQIIRYEWDFDGDGTYDYESADTPVVTHTFSSPGMYNPVLRVTDNDWLSDTDATQMLQLGQLTAIASADPLTGTANVTNFSFTGRAIDPVEGRIDNYRWDFNGDGEWDYFDFSNPDTSRKYSDPGSYTAVFQVTNSAGDTAIDSVVVQVYEAGPQASAYANPNSGDAPLTTNLVGTGNDPDGTIEFYQWDFEGDGSYDWYNLGSGSAYSTYANVGTYTPVFQVTDNTGLTGAATTQVEANLPAAWRPTAVLLADVVKGNAPLTVQFDGSGSSTPVGAITDYAWDFGDGQTASGASVPHDYTPAGAYTAALTVTSDQGGTDTTTQTIQVLPEGTPIAVANADSYTGIAPLMVDFDASGSSDDGTITLYEWYFDDIATAPFRDDMESGTSQWTAYTPWALIQSDSHSASHCWTDSPGEDYADNADVSLISKSFDLSALGESDPVTLTFWHRHEFTLYAYGRVEVSTDEGSDWTQLTYFSGTQADWTQAQVDMSAYAGESDVMVRFRLNNTYTYNGDGWYIDDVVVVGELFQDHTGTSGSVSYTYTQAGTYHPTLRVTDNEANTSTDSLTIEVTWGEPVAVASADPYTGVAPLTVDFSGTGSYDPNGSIDLYEWDFEGAFEDDMESGSGNWTAQVPWGIIDSDAHSGTHCWTDSPLGDYVDYVNTSLVTRSFDLSSSSQVTLSFWHHYAFCYYAEGWVEVSVDDGNNWTEFTKFTRGTLADWTEVRVDLSAYAGESDVMIRFRLNNTGSYNADGWYVDDVVVSGSIGTIDWSSDTTGDTSHTYNQAGIYHPILMVTDNAGFTDTDSVNIAVLALPQAQIERPLSGRPYFKQGVAFVGQGTDADGEIVLYEWDFDGNGTFDWSSTTTGVTLYSFTSPGTYTATFRVTDNSGLEESSSVSFQVIEKAPVDVEPTADTTHGNAPLDVSFDGSARDEDGSVVRYEWDFDGDGTYDWGSAGPGQVVSFSSQYNTSNWSAANLIDGVVATNDSRGWCSAYNAGFPQEIVFSLAEGNIWNIQRLDIDPQTTESSTRWAKNFQLFASTTGLEEGDFTAIAEGATFTLTNQAGFQTFTFTAMPAKYVKMLITSNYGHGNYTQLGEVAIFSGIYNVLSPLSAAADYAYDTPGLYHPTLRAMDNEGFMTTEDIDVTVFESDFLGATGLLSATSGFAPLTVNFVGFGFSGYGSLDDFEDDTIDPAIWATPVGGGNWVEADGILKQTNNDGNAAEGDVYGIYVVASDGTWDDYSFSVDIHSTGDDTMGVLFRYQNDSQYYLFEWNRQNRSGILHRRLLKRTAGGLEELATDDVAYESNRWYRIRIDVDGSQFAVYVDGELVMQGTDSDYTSGGVGLWCNSNDDTYFDNAAVAHDTPSQYKWDFGDGSPVFSSASTGAITYTYSTPGSYTATLTITDTGGTRSDSDSTQVRVLPAGIGWAKAWVTDRNHDKIVLLAADGQTVIKEVTGFNDPIFVAVNPSDGTCWVSDYYGHTVYKIQADAPDAYNVSSDRGFHQVFSGFNYPYDLDVDKRDGACWVVDRNNDRLVKIPASVDISRHVGYTTTGVAAGLGPNAYTATVVGDATPYTTAHLNGGIDLGGDSYLILPSSVLDGLGDFTFEAWFTHSFSHDGAVLSAARSGDDNALMVYLKSSGTSVHVYLEGSGKLEYTVPNLNDEGFHHLTLVRSGSDLSLYIDGAFIETKTANDIPLGVDPGGVIIGQEQDLVGGNFNSNEELDGVVDEIRVWNVVRTAQQISDSNNSELAGTESGLIAYWKCNAITPAADTLVRIGGFSNPQSVAVNGTDGVFWVADDGRDKVYRFEPDVTDGFTIGSESGSYTEIAGFSNPTHVAVDETDGTCWVADKSNHQAVKLAENGTAELVRVSGFDDPTRVAVNQTDGSVWVADKDHRQIVRLSADGTLELARAGGFHYYDFGLAVDSQTGQCWVTDTGNDDLKRLSPNGTQVSRKGGFYDPYDVDVISGEDSPENQNPPTASASADVYTGTIPFQANFTGSASDDNGSVVLYEWDFDGDGQFDYQSFASANASHIYDEQGYYQPVLRVTDNDGLVDYVHLSPVRVGHLTAEISASVTQGVGPLQVNFTASGFDPNGRITEYAWDFGGDGTYDATGASVDHTFQTQGSYSVVLRATGPSGTVYDAVIITVIPSPPTATATVTPDSGAPPLKIHLDGQASDADGSIVIYQWDYDGDGIFDWSSRTVDNTYFTYAQTGVYTATFRVIDNEGYEATDSKTITVNTPPEAAFDEATPVKGNEPLEVTFDASSSFDHDSGDSIISYDWDFGDGETATGASVAHEYTPAGTYTATLTVTDSYGGTGQATRAVFVRPAGTPTAVAKATPVTGTAPLTVDFTANSSTDDYTITNYAWDFGDWSLEGAYQLNETGYPTNQLFLGTWASTGCSDVTSMQEDILDHWPREGDTFGGKTWFAASDSDGNFNWDGVFGSHSNSYAYSHIYIYSPTDRVVRIKFGADDAARFWVNGTLAYEKTACEGVSIDKYSFEVTLNEGWNRILSSVSEGGGGWGLAYRFTDTDGNPLRLFYRVSGQIGYSSNTTGNTSHSYTTPGIYHAVLTVTDNDGNTDIDSVTITVLVPPGTPTAHAAADPSAGDVPLTVQFTGTGQDSDGSIVLYEWDFDGDGNFDWSSAVIGETQHVYSDTGTYVAVLRVTDNDGLQATDSVEIITGGVPPVAVPVAYPTSGPAPLRVKFNTKGTDADNTIRDFRWDFDGNGTYDFSSPISMTTEHTYNTPGTYNATLKVTDHDGFTHTASIEINVTVPGTPTVEAEASPRFGSGPLRVDFTAYATDQDGTIIQYRWDFGTGSGFEPATSSSQATYTYTQNGSYQAVVEVQDNDGNTATASVDVLVLDAGAPAVQASADPTEGPASLSVEFLGGGTPAAGDPIVKYEWDFNGDGAYDWDSASTGNAKHNYTQPGQYRALLKVTAQSGLYGLAAVDINVTPGFKVWRGRQSFDPLTGQTMPISVATCSSMKLTLRVVDEKGGLVRNLIANQNVGAGVHQYAWDGRNNNGQHVDPGVYYFIAEYESGGTRYVYDLTNTEGFQRQTPYQQYQSNFDPLSGDPLDIRFSLAKSAEVSMYVFAWNWGQDIRTILLKYPMTSGNKVVTWDGTDDDGNLIPTDTSYTISTSAWYLAENGMIVETRPLLSHVLTSPHYFSPAFNPYEEDLDLGISFFLSKQADVQATVWDFNSNMVRVLTGQQVSAGPNTIYWDGLNENGRLVAPGYYRVRLKAKDVAGNESQAVYSVFYLFY
ncbi:MAG: PKD domain-containing protein [Desulfobacterales bacterium]|nr:PKD domain-containing protein [Desulfobacterales bacterium]